MGALAGAAPLLRASLKHEGRGFAPWIVIATALSASSVLVYPWVFPDQQERAGLAAAVGANPALGLIFGPAFDLSTVDGFNAWRSLALGGFLTALGAIFAVVRATRGQEDSGQAELLASGVMGRATRLLAGAGLAVIGSLLVGLIAGGVTGLCGGDWPSSMLLGATFTASGWMFAGVAAVAAQLGGDSRTASSMAVGVLGALFVLRGFAYSIDAGAWAIWANPLGWMTETRPANGNHWWPLLYALAFAVVAFGVAFALQARRDFGQGAIAPRPGPARGGVRSTWRLALRLNAGPIITWTIAFAVLGVVFGYFATSIQDILGKDSAVSQILAAGATTHDALISAFLVTILSLVGILAAIPGVQTMLKVRGEEMEDRVEPLLAGAVARSRYYGGNVLIALLAPAAYVLIAGVVIASLASSADIGVRFGDALLQALVTIPAVWTVVAVSVAVIGARPKVSLAAWVGVLASFVLTLLGPTFKLWDWVLAISPFWHIPNVTETDADWWGLVWISLVTLFFLLVGFAGFSRRDLARQ
ncbi:ABC transporter permease [Leucobacter tenebrionis]|uniref:ABC transporter permease n=1 Tax=Leucobacter tenebrionis TaxID=2873270 RepID=UPI0021031399|nr:ABC transporter permease [Leucobacter tenebrionis]